MTPNLGRGAIIGKSQTFSYKRGLNGLIRVEIGHLKY